MTMSKEYTRIQEELYNIMITPNTGNASMRTARRRRYEELKRKLKQLSK